MQNVDKGTWDPLWHWLTNTFSKHKKEAESGEQAVKPKEAVQKTTNCNTRYVAKRPGAPMA